MLRTTSTAPVLRGLVKALVAVLSRALVISLSAGLFASTVACGNAEDEHAKRIKNLETYAAIPTFELIAHDGKPFGSEQMRGQISIVNFIFTRCPTVCPTFTLKFKNIQKAIGEVPVQYISISVDPQHDTTAVLADYAKSHGATSSWKFLTGDPELIKKTAEDGLKLALQRRGELEDGTPDIVHATHFVLIDRAQMIRGYYDADVKSRRESLVKDARALALSPAEGP